MVTHLVSTVIALATMLVGEDYTDALLRQYMGLGEAAPAQATLIFAGDAMQHQAQLDAARRPHGWDYSLCFDSIAPIVREADFAVVNLETTLGENGFTGYPCFCSPDTFVDALTAAGFDMMLNANNHTLDRRDRGLRRTIDVLDAKGVPHIGTYTSAEARAASLPMVRDINGFKVGFLNYTYGTNGFKPTQGAVVDYIDRSVIAGDIERTRAAGAEILAVAVHWGDEYRLLPNASQRALADFLVDKGVDLVIGGHPHVIQPMEMRTDTTSGRRSLVVYSLGNFISNMKTRDTRGGAMVRVSLGRDADGKARVDSASYRLVFTVPPGRVARQFRLLPAERCDDPDMQGRCDAFVSSATAVFDRHNVDVRRER